MKAWAIVITIFLLFTICYSIYLNEIDYGVRDYLKYVGDVRGTEVHEKGGVK